MLPKEFYPDLNRAQRRGTARAVTRVKRFEGDPDLLTSYTRPGLGRRRRQRRIANRRAGAARRAGR